MIFRNYNDFEVINLIKEGNDEAFQFLVDKYRFLIAKKIKSFNLISDYEDCFQESLMILYRSAIRFDESFDKTFTRFFEGNLHNFLITYKQKRNRYISLIVEKLPYENPVLVKEAEKIKYRDSDLIEALTFLSEFEKQIFQAKIIENRTVKETAAYLEIDEKKVYNALDRIKKKIKLHLMT